MTERNKTIRGAIFDMDGTLLDSMPIYDTAVPDMLRALGYAPRADLYDAVRPLSGTEVLAYLRREYRVAETLDELDAALDRELFAYYAQIPPLKPGVLPVLEGLAANKIPMCVATATNRVHVEAAL
ncbi:MAG: HAD family phosphatase, partial [Oscillospiraceae bacterium]|nr:HAD family phosphatase [Oscillospiraceae bacterium]